MKYRDAPYDTVLEIGEQLYAVKVEGRQFALHVRRDGTLLGVTNITADQEVTVVGKIHSDADTSGSVVHSTSDDAPVMEPREGDVTFLSVEPESVRKPKSTKSRAKPEASGDA